MRVSSRDSVVLVTGVVFVFASAGCSSSGSGPAAATSGAADAAAETDAGAAAPDAAAAMSDAGGSDSAAGARADVASVGMDTAPPRVDSAGLTSDTASGAADTAPAATDATPGATGDAQGSGGGALSCGNVTGRWKVTSWTCAGMPIDFAAAGVTLGFEFLSNGTGLETTRFHVPANQATTWYERGTGHVASYAPDKLTLSRAAPAESCSTNAMMNTSWGPVTTGVGMRSCSPNLGPPGRPESFTFDCQVTSAGLRLSNSHPTGYGPCGPNQLSVQIWQRP